MNSSNNSSPTYTFKNVRAVFVAAQANALWEQKVSILQQGPHDYSPVVFTGSGENVPMNAPSPGFGNVAVFETWDGSTGDIELQMTFSSSQGSSSSKQLSNTSGAGAGNLNVVYYGSEDHGGTDYNDTILTMVGIS